jgi:hypothetical protein
MKVLAIKVLLIGVLLAGCSKSDKHTLYVAYRSEGSYSPIATEISYANCETLARWLNESPGNLERPEHLHQKFGCLPINRE